MSSTTRTRASVLVTRRRHRRSGSMKSSISRWWDRWRGFPAPVLHRQGDRYFMLATIRGFASERLQASARSRSSGRRHRPRSPDHVRSRGPGRSLRVSTRARRAFAQAERAASEGDLDPAISLLGESAESFRQSFLPFGETLARRRRFELLLRRNGAGDRDAAQAELAAILPYWRKAKAAWYLGQLELWAADHGLAFSRGGIGADSIVASP